MSVLYCFILIAAASLTEVGGDRCDVCTADDRYYARFDSDARQAVASAYHPDVINLLLIYCSHRQCRSHIAIYSTDRCGADYASGLITTKSFQREQNCGCF